MVVAAAPLNLDLSALMPRDVHQISIPILPIGNRDALAYPYLTRSTLYRTIARIETHLLVNFF